MSCRKWFSRAVPVLLAVGITAPAALQAQGIESPRIPLRTVIQDLNTLRTSYASDWNAKDAKAVGAHYLPDAIVTNEEGERFVGAKAIGDMLAAGSASWPHMVLSSDTVKVYGATAIDFVTVKMHPSGGGELVSKYTAILHHDMNGWKVVAVQTTPVAPKKSE